MSPPASTADPETRGHRGLIAVLVVLVSALALWLATVALVRKSANDHIEESIARLRAAGGPLAPDDLDGPRPAPSEDLVAALRPIHGELAKAWDPDTFALPPRGDAPPDGEAALGVRFSAAVAAERERIEACRRASDLPAAWLPLLARPMAGNAGDVSTVVLATNALSTAALVAVWRGDGRAAADDLARVLHVARALDRQPAAVSTRLQFTLVSRVHDVLRFALVRADAPRELAELDAPLAALDPWRAATRASLRERAQFLDMLKTGGIDPIATLLTPAGGTPISPGLEHRFKTWLYWPSWNSRMAQQLDDWAAFQSQAALGCPAYFRAEPARSTWNGGDTETFRHAAAQLGRTALARAALRARFESFADADAFLAAQSDPFTGGPVLSRVEADGSWVAWCSASPEAPTQASGPLPERDHVWRVLPRR